MAIDLSKAKAGDTVKFRCGGEAPIVKITSNGGTYTVQYDGQWCNLHRHDGRRVATTNEAFNGKTPPNSPFDITAIIPAQFDWSTVKTGMGVQTPFGWGWYIGRSVIDSNYCVVLFEDNSAEVYPVSDLTRAPEHDMEVG